MPIYEFFTTFPFMWARVVKKYPSETVGNTFSPVRPGLTGEKVPILFI